MRLVTPLRLLVVLLAAGAGAALLLSGPGYRFGWWDFRVGIGLLKWAGYLGIAGTLVALVALVLPKARADWSNTLGAALVVAGAVAAVTLLWGLRAKSVPPIHDISTDTDDPPAFVAVLPLRAGAENKATYGGPEVAEQQKAAYPDVQAIVLPMPPEAALGHARNVAQDVGWDIVATDAAAGRMEATDTTLWFAFKDDIVVRVTPAANGSRIDVRSVSRVGRSDIGTNARRIRAYLERLRNT